MKLVEIIENFCPQIDAVRASALASGFGKWTPNKADLGREVYNNINYSGSHGHMLKSIAEATGVVPFPNNLFFKVSTNEDDHAYVHSDRGWGTKTCVAYLSQHEEDSGTGFFRHRETGLMEMPSIEDMKKMRIFDLLKKDMYSGTDKEWEQLDYVRGLYNRAVIFHAPLFHSRWPKTGLGTTTENGRMIWGCHYYTLLPGGGF